MINKIEIFLRLFSSTEIFYIYVDKFYYYNAPRSSLLVVSNGESEDFKISISKEFLINKQKNGRLEYKEEMEAFCKLFSR